MHNQYILIYKFESIFIILFSRKFFDIFGIVKIPKSYFKIFVCLGVGFIKTRT